MNQAAQDIPSQVVGSQRIPPQSPEALVQALRQAIDRISLSSEYVLLNRSGVNVLTIHAAKGMEFEQVFLLGCEEGSIPAYHAVKREQTGDLRFVREQQRVLYVAITRAKKVIKMYAVKQVGKYQKQLSRFLQFLTEEN